MERPTSATPSSGARPPARFLTGSLTRHILVMTGTCAIGLMCVFFGELASLLFLGLLGDVEVLAAAGYAASILFFSTSIGIGLSIAATAVISPEIGAGRLDVARRLSTTAILFAGLVGLVLVLAALPFVGRVLMWMGAAGRTHALATTYLWIALPATPLISVAMTAMAIMRSLGDAERAMNVPLIGAAIQFAIEPFCIFMLKLGMYGAATAMLVSRVFFAATGLHGAVNVHRMWQRPTLASFIADSALIMRTAVPAVLTNVATPVGNAVTTAIIAGYGDAAVAAYAIAGRLMPAAFGVVFALSGAVSPIIGQNYGARRYGRVREAFDAALRVNAGLCLLAALALVIAEPFVIRAFGVSARTADLVAFYCWFVAPTFFFLGLLFVANAAFNVLGKAHLGTILNWSRATLGTIPLAWLGGQLYGAEGVMLGSAVGGIVAGLLSVWLTYRILPTDEPRT